MQEVFARLIEKLKESSYERYRNNGMGGELVVNYDEAIEIVKQEAEQYNNGWIPCSSGNKPKDNKWVFGYTDYHEIVPTFFEDGVWHDNYGSPRPELKIIAYCTLPEPFQPKGE